MKILRTILVYGTLALSLFFLWENVLRAHCSRVIEYDVGTFDERFGIKKEAFITYVELAEIPWEEKADKQLFRYVPGAEFKINLIWSEEQERLYKGEGLEEDLDSVQESIDTVQGRYQSAVSRYERATKDYEQKLHRYERDVTYWNGKGGAPTAEYDQLQNQAKSLEKKANEVGLLLANVNKLADENNQRVGDYNNGVAEYNNLFNKGHEFDAGNTDGTEINVYTYDGVRELQTLLTHEFGHVLGIDHVEDEGSVMYYLLNSKNQKGELSNVDIAALELTCKL